MTHRQPPPTTTNNATPSPRNLSASSNSPGAFLEAKTALVATLVAECASIEREREAYRALDATALIGRLSERAAFVDRACRQSKQLEQTLHGLERDDVVRRSLAEVRAASRRLYRLEKENAALITRTQSVLGSVLDTVAPAAKTYDIRGQRRSRPFAAYARVSRRV